MTGFLKKVLVFLLMLVLVVDIPIIVFSSFTDAVLLDDGFYKEEFEKIGLYSFFEEKLVETLQQKSGFEGSGFEALEEGIKSGWIREQIDTNVENLIGYLRGRSAEFKPRLELKSFKSNVVENYPESTFAMAQFPDEYSPEGDFEVPDGVRQLTINIVKIRNASVMVALVCLLLAFLVYSDKSLFFTSVGRRVALAGGLPLLFLLALHLKTPAILSRLPSALPSSEIGMVFQDLLQRLGFYNGLVLGVGALMYGVGFAMRKVFEGKGLSGEP